MGDVRRVRESPSRILSLMRPECLGYLRTPQGEVSQLEKQEPPLPKLPLLTLKS